MSMRLFAQLKKVDVATRTVIGRACQEVVDHVGEVFDYEKSKPYFQSWSDECSKATDGKSLGNVRAMHGKVAAGKLTQIDFHDADKAIDVAAKVVDDAEWAKVLEGVYTGFSIGGSYVGDKTTEKMNGKDVVRYVAKPNEISLVDAPCIPTAKFLDIVKADGAIEKVAFKTPDVTIAGSPEQVDELAKLMADSKLDMAAVIALVKGKPTEPLDKGMWNVQDFAAALTMLSNVAYAAKSEAEWEGDKSPIPEKLRKWLGDGVSIFKAMAKEETDELMASLKTAAGKSIGTQLELMKAVHAPAEPVELTTEEVADVVKAAPSDLAKALTDAKIAKGGKASMQKVHDMLGELGAKCGAADKAAPAGELAKSLATALERIEKLEKQPVPHVALRMVSKTGETEAPDVSKITFGDLKSTQVILKADGSIDYEMSVAVAQQTARMAHKESSAA